MSFVDGLNLGMTAADRCRTAEMLAFYISPDHLGTLRMICRSMAFVEVKRQGTADLPRVGDRVLSPAQRQLRSLVLECVVEGVRAGIQTGFYTCNYSAKPSMTCGPVLKHMTHGMAQLEARLETEAAERQARRVLAAFPAGQAPFNVPATGEEPLQGRFTEEERECRRRLCRLWTAANQAVMKGNCLMSMQLLTGREVIRTHRFWRIMMKRVVWGLIQSDRDRGLGCSRKRSGGNGPDRDSGPDLVSGEGSRARKRSGDKGPDRASGQGSLHGGTASGAVPSDVMMGTDQEPVTDIQVSGGVARLRSTSFYEDYLHRGSEEPLASMSLYVYAMHVACVHVRQSGHHVHGEFLFEEHYCKSKTHVQVLQGEPRVPYLHGITVPSRSKDAYMRAVSHLCLFKPHRCCRSDVCGHAVAVDNFRCATVPLEWKVTEAELQTCADRADVPRLVYRYKACGMCAGYLKGCRVEGLRLSSAAGKVDDRAPMRDGILSVCCCRSLPPHVCESWFGICKAVVSDLTD